MKAIFSVLLSMTSIGILPVWGFYRSLECRHDPLVIRCEDGHVISVEKAPKGRFVPPKIYCDESILPRSRQPDITICLLEYLQNECNNRSLCNLHEQREHSCSTSERRKHFMTYKCITRCGPDYTCNEATEVCKDSEDGASCQCAENYHKNENDACIPDLYIRCDSGVINITKSEERERPTLKVHRGHQVIPDYGAPCSSEKELTNTQARCNNQQVCKISEQNSDGPCLSYMVYDCVPKCGFNDSCDMTTQVCKNTGTGIRCECAENYQENSESNCTAKNITHSGSHQFANESVFIYCDNGTINVERATHGERPTFTVMKGGKVMPHYFAPCLSHEVLDSLETMCDNKSRCKISDAIDEDSPCQGYMNYTCEMNTTQKEISQCPNMSINIHCHIGIIRIEETTQKFGKPTFTMNYGEKVIKNYSVPCLSKNEFTRIRDKCDTKASCNISYEINEDSPCHSYLNYTCVSRCGITDNCNNTSEVCIDSKNGTKCHCAEGYERNNDGVCTEIVPKCPYTVQNVKGVIMTFNETLSGKVASSNQLCPPESAFPNSSLATRKCTGTWEEPEPTECYTADTLNDQLEVISEMDVTDDNVKEVAGTLAIASGQPEHITEDGLESLITSLDSVVQVGKPSPQVTDSVVGVVSNVMAINESTLSDTQNVNTIVSVLENQVASLLKAGQNYSVLTNNVEVNALQIERASLQNNYTFLSHLGGDTSGNDDVEDECKTSSILLPPSLLHSINKVDPGIDTVPISLIAYQDDSLFQTEDVKSSEDSRNTVSVIGSHVISATVEITDVTVKDLPPDSNVLTRFSHPVIPPEWNDTNITLNFVCVYWDTEKAMWSKDGCTKTSNESDYEIVCSCDHLTSFAVLVRAHQDTPFDQVLAITSKVGCIFCIISLSCCILALLLVRPVRKKQQTHVHLNLCLALLGFYFSFLLGIDKAQKPKLCKAMTSLIYFFCLSSMAWMSVEAFYIYTLIWKYKRSGIKHFIPVAALFAWGLPAFGSGLVYVLDEPHGYVIEPDYCFIHPGYLFNFGFILEMGLLFLYNIIVFSLVTYRVSCRRIYFSKKDEKRIEIMTRVKSTFLFWILLGISWIFGFVPIVQRSSNHFCEAMFCLCMSLQGFCMLYMLILQNPEMMKTLRGKRKPLFSSVTMASGMKNVYVIRRNSAKGSTLGMQSNPLSSTTEYF